jgi:hypothetical protein
MTCLFAARCPGVEVEERRAWRQELKSVKKEKKAAEDAERKRRCRFWVQLALSFVEFAVYKDD